MTATSPTLVLFDLDGVLVEYDRPRRLQHLGDAVGRTADHVQEALFGSGLEDRYDAGLLSTDAYLDELGRNLDCNVDRATWSAARLASMTCAAETCTRVARLAQRVEIGVLTNNGVLVESLLPVALPGLFPLLEGRVFCSGLLRASKPSQEIFHIALERLGHTPHHALFLDGNFDNVEGARAAGLFAEHVAHPGAFDTILACYGL